MSEADAPGVVRTIADIPGWFSWIDAKLFGHFLAGDAVVPRGDLVEIGVYLGKSAALIGQYKAPDETFTVCDLFGREASDSANNAENTQSYQNLSRERFERNYLALHPALPVIIEDDSSAIVGHVKPGSARFVHVDGSHHYAHVAVDVESARTMLLPDGVVAFDDFRSDHTPGVAAAVWEAVFTKELRPICVTAQKLYATFGNPDAHRARLEPWLSELRGIRLRTDLIAGQPVLRIAVPSKKGAKRAANPSTATNRKADKPQREVDKLQREVVKLQREVAELRRDRAATLGARLRRRARAAVRRARSLAAR